MFAGKAIAYSREGTFQVLHSRVDPWPYPQTLDSAGRARQGQTLQLITKIRKLRPQKVLQHWHQNVVFLYVSDDLEWGKTKLGKAKNIFFVGCGNGDDMDCVGNDFAVLIRSTFYKLCTHYVP
jgi:hypothetical protein